MKRAKLMLLPVPVDGELKGLVEEAAAQTHLSQAAVMRSALRIGVPQVVNGLVTRRPRRNLVEYLDAFVGLVKRDTQKPRPTLGRDTLTRSTAPCPVMTA